MRGISVPYNGLLERIDRRVEFRFLLRSKRDVGGGEVFDSSRRIARAREGNHMVPYRIWSQVGHGIALIVEIYLPRLATQAMQSCALLTPFLFASSVILSTIA